MCVNLFKNTKNHAIGTVFYYPDDNEVIKIFGIVISFHFTDIDRYGGKKAVTGFNQNCSAAP